ncbi:ABC transporter ATP-binding protein [Microbacterium sp.]|uniref:ABC transporter ATP-binding protein n=1 Tax=Microbacterium sp. TaxID=51671 RepID=UPI003A918C70
MTAPLLRVADVAIRHEGADAATPAAATFEVRAGEVVLLLGPSGSGKSTLTLALNGLIPQDVPATVDGAITVGGQDATTTQVATLSTRVGMVFQDPDAQIVTGTVLDEVAFGPENLRLSVADVLARTEAALRRVGLWERRRDNPDTLSGGGRQRLAIAAALALGSDLLVLDEPTANLDPQGIDEVYRALAEVVADGEKAIVLVEHNLDHAVALVDRVVVLDATGRTFADGPTDDILRGRAAELHDLGVWLPTSTLAALRLRRAGYALDPLPLTPAELRAALELAPAPSPPPAPSPAPPPSPSASPPEPRTIRPHEDFPAADVLPSADRPPVGRPSHHARTPILTARGLTLRRGRVEVLHGVDLEIRPGEFVAVIGANGAGKTSLLYALAGVVRPPRGTVHVQGDDVSRLRPRELTRRIGFVFQNPEHQFISDTVRGELAHGLNRLADGEASARVDDLLERFGLTDKADVHPFLLSGGQKRRLSVGTALVTGAPILALDEPTFGQDRARADELLALLSALNAGGTTVLIVTHDMQVVTEYATRTIVLDAGRVLADAPTADVFAEPTLLERAGLRLPPLREALSGLRRHPELAGITRLGDLPGRDVACERGRP